MNVLINYEIDNENCLVRLMGEVFIIGKNFLVYIVFWCKNGVKKDIKVRWRISVYVSIRNLLFIIYNVSFEDVGFYCFIVISYVGIIESEIVFGSFVIVFIFVNFF